MAFLCLKPPIYFLMCLGDSPSSVAHLQSPAIQAASGPHTLTLPSARLTHPPGPGLPFSLLTDLALPPTPGALLLSCGWNARPHLSALLSPHVPPA